MAALFIRGLGSTIALLAATFAACGGRTLDTDFNDVVAGANAGQSSSGAGAANGGAGGDLGKLGHAGASPAAGAANGNLLAPACTQYCKALASSSCSNRFETHSNCVAECGADHRFLGCEAPAVVTLDCLSDWLSLPIPACDQLLTAASAGCANELQGVQSCQARESPPPPAATCLSSGTGTTESCELTFKCSNGVSYRSSCERIGDSWSQCSCSSSAGDARTFAIQDGVGMACYSAAAPCGAPANPAPIPK